MSKNCIDTKNHEKVRVIFTEKQRQLKSITHSELREHGFIKRIEETIKNPSFIYGDLSKRGRLVYYRYEYSVNGRARYIKAVIEKQGKYMFVITAYRPDFVKERNKSKLLYGEDNN